MKTPNSKPRIIKIKIFLYPEIRYLRVNMSEKNGWRNWVFARNSDFLYLYSPILNPRILLVQIISFKYKIYIIRLQRNRNWKIWVCCQDSIILLNKIVFVLQVTSYHKNEDRRRPASEKEKKKLRETVNEKC